MPITNQPQTDMRIVAIVSSEEVMVKAIEAFNDYGNNKLMMFPGQTASVDTETALRLAFEGKVALGYFDDSEIPHYAFITIPAIAGVEIENWPEESKVIAGATRAMDASLVPYPNTEENLNILYTFFDEGVFSNGTILYSSSDESVATYDDGDLTAISEGETTISCTIKFSTPIEEMSFTTSKVLTVLPNPLNGGDPVVGGPK